MIQINLLPGGAKRKARGTAARGFAPREILASLNDRIRDKYLVGAIASAIVVAALVAFMLSGQRSAGSRLGERERREVQDSARFATVLTARVRAETERDLVMRQLAIIRSIDDNRFMWPHLLEEISRAVPAYTWLTSISQTSAPLNAAAPDSEVVALQKDTSTAAGRARLHRARRDKALALASRTTRFRVVGNTVDIQALTRFMKDLEASPFIQNVQLARSDLVPAGGTEVTEFQLDAETQRPDSSVIQTVPLTIRVQ